VLLLRPSVIPLSGMPRAIEVIGRAGDLCNGRRSRDTPGRMLVNNRHAPYRA
jgi:hypothetical protein